MKFRWHSVASASPADQAPLADASCLQFSKCDENNDDEDDEDRAIAESNAADGEDASSIMDHTNAVVDVTATAVLTINTAHPNVAATNITSYDANESTNVPVVANDNTEWFETDPNIRNYVDQSQNDTHLLDYSSSVHHQQQPPQQHQQQQDHNETCNESEPPSLIEMSYNYAQKAINHMATSLEQQPQQQQQAAQDVSADNSLLDVSPNSNNNNNNKNELYETAIGDDLHDETELDVDVTAAVFLEKPSSIPIYI